MRSAQRAGQLVFTNSARRNSRQRIVRSAGDLGLVQTVHAGSWPLGSTSSRGVVLISKGPRHHGTAFAARLRLPPRTRHAFLSASARLPVCPDARTPRICRRAERAVCMGRALTRRARDARRDKQEIHARCRPACLVQLRHLDSVPSIPIQSHATLLDGPTKTLRPWLQPCMALVFRALPIHT